MNTYEKVADLKLQIDSFKFTLLKQKVSSGFERYTTIVHLSGNGHEGQGEDVDYLPDDHKAFQKYGPTLNLSGSYTFRQFSKLIGDMDLFKPEPALFADVFRQYRRWAFESAALSLALKQNNTTLSKALRLPLRPLNYVVSMNLGKPSSAKPVKLWLKLYPGLRFKLDAVSDWDDKLISELVKLNAVNTIDLKGHYKGAPDAPKTDIKLYRRIVDAFPSVWIEDPDVTKSTKPVLKPHASRVTWDAPLHKVEDIKKMPFLPKTINIKPSRFGGVEELFGVYDYCKRNNIAMYGGGQFELGIGRQQIQYLASLFHPNMPNDVAPKEFNSPKPVPNLSQPPLSVNDIF